MTEGAAAAETPTGKTPAGVTEFETLSVDTNIPMYIHGSDAALRRSPQLPCAAQSSGTSAW